MSDFAIILAAALIGGILAYRLKLPAVLGYLVAGIFVGPYSFRLVQDVGLTQTMASIGVVLLMFTLGMEFSTQDLRQAGKVGIAGGTAQILLTTAFGILMGKMAFGWSMPDAVFFGFLISLSSTMVVLKILVERGETNTPHGRIMIAILLLQDLAVVPLMVVLPALGQPTEGMVLSLGVALGKAILFMGIAVVIGFWLIPVLLGRVAGARSRELFLITILAISLGSAFATSYFGVSQAFGAFAAGMLVSRSHFAHQALADIVPFRNAFAALFFVSLGMLASPRFMLENWAMVLMVALVIVVGKFIICSLIARHFRYSTRTVLYVGMGLTQVGEFSFVLGQAGLEAGVMSEYLYSIILSSAILTILFAPIAFKLADKGIGWLSTSKRMAPYLQLGSDKALVNVEGTLSNHVIICGHGRAGGNLSGVLQRYSIPYIVVELNPQTVSELRSKGIPSIYGDAGNHQILSIARVERARVLALTCPDPMAQIAATAYAKRVNPDIDIIVRLADQSVVEQLQRLGTSEVVEPAFEASLEFVRHTLGYYGVAEAEVDHVVCPFLRGRSTEDKDSASTPVG
ncbi:MAG: cation:proton antiporter [Chloroflexota bacterium]